MHIVGASDLHLTDKSPINRKDDYYATILGKFFQILKITQNTKHKRLLIAGDIFDSPTVPYDVARTVVRILLQFPAVSLFIVPGQHDQRWHKTGLDNTPLGLIAEYPNVFLLSNKAVFIIENTTIIGAGWNEEPKDKADILVTHQMVVKKEKLFFDQEDYSTGIALFKKYPWAKCIISGDNHQPFKISYKGRLLVNCGSMVRSTKKQINHKPKVWIINTKKWTAKAKNLSILKPEKAFDFDKIAKEEIKEEMKKNAEKEIDKFISSLPSSSKQKISPKKMLKYLIDQEKPHKRVKKLINQIMEEVSE